jgi:hypothetical protein
MNLDRRGTAHLTWGTKAQESFITAKKHFDKFLTAVPDAKLAELCDPPLGGHTYDTMDKENVSYQLFDLFAGYLFHAKWYYNEEKSLSFSTADRYLSSIKNGILRDVIVVHKVNRDLSNDVGMKRIRDGMVKGFTERAMNANKSLVNSHETSTVEDLLTIATVCVWSDDVEMACTNAYQIALMLLAGRGVEIALVPHVSTQDTARRAGYDLKSVATIFEYLLKENPFRDRQVGMVFNHWSALTPLGTIGGGRPPRLEAVRGQFRLRAPIFILRSASRRQSSFSVPPQ